MQDDSEMNNEALRKQDQQKSGVTLKAAKLREFTKNRLQEAISLAERMSEKIKARDVTGSLLDIDTIIVLLGEIKLAGGKDEIENGSWYKGIKALREARAIFAEVGDWLKQAQASVEIGDAHLQMGDYEVARMAYLDAQRYLRKIGDEAGLAVVKQKLGTLALYMYKADEAEKQLKEALNFFESHGDERRAELSRQLLQLAPEVRQKIPA